MSERLTRSAALGPRRLGGATGSGAASRMRLGLLAAAGGGLLVLLWLMLGGLGSGGSQIASADAEVPEGEQDTAPDVDELDPADEATDPEPVPVTYEVYIDRDPFEPVREPEVEPDDDGVDGVVPVEDDETAPDSDDPDAPDAPSDPTDPTDPSDPDGNEGPPPADTPPGEDPKECTGDREEQVCDGRVVTLERAAPDGGGDGVATVQVGTEIYDVGVGDRFAEQFVVRAIGDGVVTLSFVDSTFDLEEGQTVMK